MELEIIVAILFDSSVCSCGHGDDADTVALTALSRQYQVAVQELVISGRYDNRDDFTVVNQPLFRNTVPPSKVNRTLPSISSNKTCNRYLKLSSDVGDMKNEGSDHW